MFLRMQTDTRIETTSTHSLTLTVLNLESFYNYRTKGEKFELVTSVLSHHDYCKTIDIKNKGTKTSNYVVVDEVFCSNTAVHYMNIHSKKKRIHAALLQVKITNEKYLADPIFLNHFVLSMEPGEEDSVLRIKPEFCRGEHDKTRNKLPCAECDTVCAYTMEDLLDKKHGIGQGDIKLELEKHHHPKSRMMTTGKQRNTQESARELANHYIYSHNQQEPNLL